MLEKCYRDLYQEIAEIGNDKINYKLKIKNSGVRALRAWVAAIIRPVLIGFYGVALILVLICLLK